jgi:hypothetical protein
VTTKLMLDSGAYAVWTQGAKVDLEGYVSFCEAYPSVSYYVALDVIPGSPKVKRSSSLQVEEACKEGWRNYRYMITRLPKEKVIPVYHYKDDVKWLHKILESGCGYIGIGGLAKAETDERITFLRGLRRILFDGAGRAVVKVHGFGLTSFDVMTYWNWYSVDSTSWKLTGAWGGIYVPKKRQGRWCYSEQPHTVGVSPMSPSAQFKQRHITSMSPYVREQAMEYIAELGLKYGEWEVHQVEPGYSIARGSEEVWYSRKKWLLLRHTVKGVATSFEERCKHNSRFIKKVNKALPIKHIYFAGAPMPYDLEYKMGRRLLSFFDVGKTGTSKIMDKHVESMR